MLSPDLERQLHEALRSLAHLEALALLFHAIAQGGGNGLFVRAREDLNRNFPDDARRDHEIAQLARLLSDAHLERKPCSEGALPSNPLLIAAALGMQLGASFLSTTSDKPIEIHGKRFHAFKIRPSRLHKDWTSPRRWFQPIWFVETPINEKEVKISHVNWSDGSTPICALIEFDDNVSLDNETKDETFIVRGLADEGARWDSLVAALKIANEAKAQIVVLPELSMTQTLLGKLSDWLNEKTGHSFRLVAAGSYHHLAPSDKVLARNRMMVLDRRGNPLFHHDKWYEYDCSGRERISPGNALQLLYAPPGLLSFAICKDFCHLDGFDWKALALDGLCVASMGDNTTLTAHRHAAREMKVVGTRVLLVNITKESDGTHRGFFSLPGADPQVNADNVTLRSWNEKPKPPLKRVK